jgi:tetratricopeptide (TPR) repeat protein
MKKIIFYSLFILLPLIASANDGKAAAAPAKGPDPRSLELNEEAVKKIAKQDFQGAEETLRKAIAIDSGNLTAVFNLAGMFISNKKLPDAINLLESYIKIFPKDAGLHARLGDAYFVDKKLDPALTQYQQAIALSPQYPGVAARLGTLYSLQNNAPLAEEYFTKAVELIPNNPELLANLASVKLANAKPKEAIDYAERSLRIKQSKEAYSTLGSAYRGVKNFKNALSAFREAQQLGDNSKEVKAAIAELENNSNT